MGYQDSVQVRGVSEACKYNDHTICRAPGCGCDCHVKAEAVREQVQEAKEVEIVRGAEPKRPGGPMVCPQCRQRRPHGEVFCRRDGAKLLSLLCWACQEMYEPGDAYCWACGTTLEPSDREKQGNHQPSPKPQPSDRKVESPRAAKMGWVGKLPSSAFREK